MSGGAAHLVAHASIKALLFLAAGAWLDRARHQAAGRPAAAWLVAGGWSAGPPRSARSPWPGVAPLALWATKDAVLAAALEQSPALYAVGLAAAALSAAYAGKVLVVLWRRPPERRARRRRGAPRRGAAGHPSRRRRWSGSPLVVLALGAVVLGLLALPPVGGTLARALGEEPLHPARAGDGRLGSCSRWPCWRWCGGARCRSRAGQLDWLGLGARDDSCSSYARPCALAEALARFDDRVLDRGVTAHRRGGGRARATGPRPSTTGCSTAPSRRPPGRRCGPPSWRARDDDRWLDGAVEAARRLAARPRPARPASADRPAAPVLHPGRRGPRGRRPPPRHVR